MLVMVLSLGLTPCSDLWHIFQLWDAHIVIIFPVNSMWLVIFPHNHSCKFRELKKTVCLTIDQLKQENISSEVAEPLQHNMPSLGWSNNTGFQQYQKFPNEHIYKIFSVHFLWWKQKRNNSPCKSAMLLTLQAQRLFPWIWLIESLFWFHSIATLMHYSFSKVLGSFGTIS